MMQGVESVPLCGLCGALERRDSAAVRIGEHFPQASIPVTTSSKFHFAALVARSNSCRRTCSRFLLVLHLLRSSSPSFLLAFLLMST